MVEPVCVVTGVGPGTGSALARRFAKGGYRVALLARDRQRLAALEQELPGAKAYPCDVSDAQQVDKTAELIERDLGGRRCWSTMRWPAPSARSWKSTRRC